MNYNPEVFAVYKKLIALITAFMSIVSFASCSGEDGLELPLLDFSKTQVEIVNDIDGDTSLDNTIKYASQVNDIAQSYYANTARTSYVMSNADMTIVQSLNAKKNSATVYNNDGAILFEDTFNSSYVDSDGDLFDDSESRTAGRVNATRLGEYYRECHIRDFSFNDTVKIDKTYHLYGDRLYTQFSLLSEEPLADISCFETSVKIKKESVESFVIKDADGAHSSIDNESAEYVCNNAEYVAFDVRNAGVAGLIFPADKNYTVIVRVSEDCYSVTVCLNHNKIYSINNINGEGGFDNNCMTLGFRLYADKTHTFDFIDAEAAVERNPLTDLTVNGGNAGGKFLGYDSLSGAYLFSMKGTDFNYAYKNPDLQYSLPLSVQNDSYDRNIYIRSKGDNGCLEAAAILDDTNTLIPVNVQVCKNFHGDGGEPFYSADDPQYGDSIFPVSLKAEEKIDFTLLNLYQNWGKYPLKQLSSIEFHVSYYHLSTGVTESNCIAPYFVFGKDGWTLPDFRTASGKMWETQPQFNSEGILKFMTYRDGKKDVYSEFVHSETESVGQTYSDITNTFIADSGAYKYSLRHVEFPQTDENRTYYTLEVEFLEDATYNNFKKDFDLFYFDGRMVQFDNVSYVADDGEVRYVEVNKDKKPEYYVLGENNPYWGFYNVSDSSAEQLKQGFGTNFAMIIRDSSMIIGGEESEIPFVFRDSSVDDFTTGALTLDAEKITFNKGDTISIDMVLLPWGDGTEETDENVQYVREDCALKPVTITAITGDVNDDSILPIITCENNTAEFTVKGGRNNISVRMNGFTSIECPEIQKKTENGWETVELSSSNGYDGYSVFYNADGTYGFSFVYTAETPEMEYTFRAVQYTD